jgi:hypothetical protein
LTLLSLSFRTISFSDGKFGIGGGALSSLKGHYRCWKATVTLHNFGWMQKQVRQIPIAYTFHLPPSRKGIGVGSA